MRRIDQLISQVRRDTENVEFTDTAGISDEDFIDYSNRAQDRMLSLIQLSFPDILQDEVEFNAVAQQEAYDIPRNLFLGTRIDQLEYSSSGNDSDYYLLTKGHLRERLNGTAGDPSFYIRRSSSVLIQPKPQGGGTFRITFQKVIPKLDIRRGIVSVATLGVSSITTLTLDNTANIDDDVLNDYGMITVVSGDGTVKMRDIPISSANGTSGVIVVAPGFTFETGETIAVGDYVCAGPFASTHSQLPEVCERYLLAYMDWKIYHRDSNNDSQEQAQEVQQIEQDIIASFSQPDSDVITIPIITNEYLFSEE